uniref:INTS5_C domain-containing protein n=1 Tax=Syphacia muris TaxID=451379 RepID=A0A0N5AXJ6_9BILA
MRPVWATRPLSSLLDPARTILKSIPESRMKFIAMIFSAICLIKSNFSSAVLQYLGFLTHEAAHLHFSRKENVHISGDIGNVEKAVEYLCSDLTDLLNYSSVQNEYIEIFKFGCALFVEICQCNCDRPSIKKAGGVAPVVLLPLFESCSAISSVIRLVDVANLKLLKTDPELCLNIILENSRHGFSFDWVWLHIASKFPSYIIPHLLRVGANDFRHYVLEVHKQQESNPVAVVEMHEAQRHKFVSLSEVFNFLSSKGFAELESVTREALTKGIESLEDVENDEELLSENTDFSVAFLFKLLTNSADVLRYLVEHAFDIVTSAAVMNAAKQLSLINKQCVLPNVKNMDSYGSFFHQMVFAVEGPALTRIFELAYPFAFDERVYEEASRKNRSLCNSMKEGAFKILEEIVGSLLVTIHIKAVCNLTDCGILMRLGCDSKKLDECVSGALTAGPRIPFFIRYLHAFCLVSGLPKSWEVLCRFIMKAEDEDQILSLSALLTTIMPFDPRLVSGFIENFCSIRIALEREEKRRNRAIRLGNETAGADIYDYSIDVRWIENLTILNEWGKAAAEHHPLKTTRFEMGKNAAQLLCGILRWSIDELYHAREKASNDYDSAKCSLINAVCSLVHSLAPMPVQPPKYTFKLCAQFASLFVEVLKDVGDEKEPYSVSLFNAFSAAVLDILRCQLLYIREQFIIHLLDEVLAQGAELFGGRSLNVWETEEHFASGCSKEDLFEYCISSKGDYESLFEKARKIPLFAIKPSQMAHSGKIAKKTRKSQEFDLKHSEHLRRLIFIDKLQTFFPTNGTNEPNKFLCKQLALTLSDRICKDALTNGFVWDDWEFERELTSKYVAVAKRVAEIPLVWDVMFILAEIHPCLWFCFPLIKAVFASVLIQFENNSDQTAKPSSEVLRLLNRWFLLTLKGKMLPMSLAKVFKVVAEVRHREGFLILLEIWKYFSAVLNEDSSHPVAVLNSLFEKTANGSTELLQIDPSRFKDTCRIVIQQNIVRLGDLFPVVFADELSKLSVQ